MTTSKQIEPPEAIAASRVLLRMLGSHMYEVITYHLSHKYHIKLSGGQKRLDLEDLGNALVELVGDGGAKLIMKEVCVELDKLSSK